MLKCFLLFFLLFNCKKTNIAEIEKNYSEKNYIQVIKIFPITEKEKFFVNLSILNLNQELERLDESEKKIKLNEISKIKHLKLNKGKLKTFSISESSDLYLKFFLESNILELENLEEEEFLDKLNKVFEFDLHKDKDLFRKFFNQVLKKRSIKNLSLETKNKIWDRIYYLNSIFEKSKFYFAKGKNINLRQGPGVENSAISKLTNEEVFAIEEDFKEVEIGKKLGKWFFVHSIVEDKKGWIFSAFLTEQKLDIEKLEKIKLALNEEFKYQKFDFEEWDEKTIPKNFYGSYFPKEKFLDQGKTFFPIYESDFKTEICLKPNSSLKKLNFNFEKFLDHKIYFLKLKLGSIIFQFELDEKNLYLQDFSFAVKNKIWFKFNENKISLNNKIIYESEKELKNLEICFPSSKEKSDSKIYLESIYMY